MPKKLIAAHDLVFLIHEELRPLFLTSHTPSVAVVPHRTEGWTTLTSRGDYKKRPALAGHIRKIEKALKRRFDLKSSD